MSLWSSSPLWVLAVSALLAFAVLSLVDGVYLHLIRYRLYAHASSWREHLWHTGRALLLVPILVLIFAQQTGGALLYVGIGFVLLDQLVELFDVLSEKESRAPLGGLSSFEYALHVMLTTLRIAAITLALAARPAAAWSLEGATVPLPEPLSTLVWNLVPGAVIATAAHVWLAWKHAPRARAAVRMS